ncbi:MAG TPA: pyridoxal phosphate-dependent aminotransferase [Gammaproteobacteria bacterium]|nr:pyridoxal phosphate-dependent aminotransferase [Gammaproteobacteria bacterium]
MSLSHLSLRAQKIKPSPTMAITNRAKLLQAEGKDLISLTVGEPDFDTPEFIKDAARDALNKGYTKYTAVDGIPELKQAVINKFERDNKLSFSPKEISAAAGCKQSVYNTIQALISEGDEVIIPAPYWVSYPDMVLLADGKNIFIETTSEQSFKITAEQLEKAITPKTKLLILNSPSNPTGICYSRKELEKLAEVLLKHPQVYILSDDMYEHIIWGAEKFCNILMACPALKSRTIICHGVAKSYAMTGWRIGYAAGPVEIITAMNNIQSQSTSNPNSIAQYAAVAALNGDQTCVHEMTAAYQRRHQIVFEGLSKIKNIKVLPATGTFYSFPDISNAMKHYKNDLELCEALLVEAGVVVVPGSAFGCGTGFRIAYATSEELLHKAMERLQKWWGHS